MSGKAIVTLAEIALGQGIVTLDRETLVNLPAESYARNGVILVNDRRKAFIADADGRAVEYTVSLYIQRAPVTDDETDAVNGVKGERDAAKKAKLAEEQDRLAREKRAAFELGQESTMTAIKNIGALAQGAAALTRLGNG